jgi:hypothetical protein
MELGRRRGANDADVGFAWSGRRRASAASHGVIGLRRALSPTFPAGELVFFIPLRVVAENPARRISTCSGRLGGAAAAGRTMVRSPAALAPIPL